MLVVVPNGVAPIRILSSWLWGNDLHCVHLCARVLIRASVRLPGCSSSILLACATGPKSDKDCVIMRCSAKLSQSSSWSLFFVVPKKKQKKKQSHPLLIKPQLVLRPSQQLSLPVFSLFFSFFRLSVLLFSCFITSRRELIGILDRRKAE